MAGNKNASSANKKPKDAKVVETEKAITALNKIRKRDAELLKRLAK